MDDITKQPYAKWLEESIATIAGLDPCCICFAATKADGTVFTGYYNADATDKAVFAHNIRSDIVMDIIKANTVVVNGKRVTTGPVGCKLHKDKEHQDIAATCGYCDDFHCFQSLVSVDREMQEGDGK